MRLSFLVLHRDLRHHTHPAVFPLLKNDKKHQLEGKLQDIRCRLTTQRQEIESTNKSRELRIAEITHLQQQLQVSSMSVF